MEKSLPKGWVETQLIELLETLESGTRPKGGVQGILEGVPSIGGEHLSSDGGFNFKNVKYIPTQFAERLSRGRIFKNDILIVKDGATTGKTSFVDKRFPFETAFVNEHVFICRPSSGINSKILFYFMRSKIGQNRIMSNFAGAAQGGINSKFASNTLLPIPPLPEQERIVAKLDKLFAQHEKIKQALDRIPQMLKAFRQQVLTQAVTGKLTEQWREGKDLEDADVFIKKIINDRNVNDPTVKRKISFESVEGSYEAPDKWSFSFLQNLGEFTRGKSKHRPRNDKRLFNGIYPFIQTGDVSNASMYINDYKNTYNEFGLKQSRLFPKGTLCITIAANIAETAILNFDSCFPDSVVGYIPYKKLYSSEFAMYFINTIQRQLEHFAPATAQKNINMAILTEIPFPVPPLQEQQEIVRRVESLFAKADTIEARYQKLKEKVDKLPQAILHKAFRGELVPQLPTDGDAKDLLADILALKAENKRKK